MKALYVPAKAGDPARIVEINDIRYDTRRMIEGAAERKSLGPDSAMYVNHYGSWLGLPANERVAALIRDISTDRTSEIPCGPVVITGCDPYGEPKDVPEHLMNRLVAVKADQSQAPAPPTNEPVDDEYSIDIDFQP